MSATVEEIQQARAAVFEHFAALLDVIRHSIEIDDEITEDSTSAWWQTQSGVTVQYHLHGINEFHVIGQFPADDIIAAHTRAQEEGQG